MKKISVKKMINSMILFSSGIVFTLLISNTYAANSYVGNATDITYSNNSTSLSSTTIDGAIDELADRSKYGNVTSTDILSGKTALSDGNKITGSMVNNGSVSASINPGGTYTIPAGFHDGTGIITAKPNQNSGTYTYAANSTGGNVDLGANNTYRYVNATNVYNKGKTDGAAAAKMTRTVVKSGLKLTGNTTVSCTGVSGYNSLSTSNFAVNITKVESKFTDYHDSYSFTGSQGLSYSYNASNGVLTISYNALNYNHSGYMELYVYPTVDVIVYK